MRIVAIIQGRMGSARLPGKTLMDIGGKPTLQRVIERLQKAALDEIVVATSSQPQDGIIVACAESLGIHAYCGSERDVLDRYVGAAHEAEADIVVRVTADCPLLDAGIVDRVVHCLRSSRYDFASNAITRTFPIGLDVEACWIDTLERIDRLAITPQAREHVFWFAYKEKPELFVIREVKDRENNSDLHWTLDTQEDLQHIRHIFSRGADMSYQHLIERERRMNNAHIWESQGAGKS